MGVEAAVRQADLLHDVGDARAVVPASPNGPRGGPDDAFVGDFLAAWGGPPGGGSAHMMSIIYQSGAERKRPTPGPPDEPFRGVACCGFRCELPLQDSNLVHLIQSRDLEGTGFGQLGRRRSLAEHGCPLQL